MVIFVGYVANKDVFCRIPCVGPDFCSTTNEFKLNFKRYFDTHFIFNTNCTSWDLKIAVG